MSSASITLPQASQLHHASYLSRDAEAQRLDGSPAGASPRHRLAFDVEQVLRDNLRTSIDINAVCKAVGASERTLHAAFRAQFGTTPMSYLKNLRLDAVHHALLHARRGETVTQIATRWGFLHFGWFARDYQLRFGELPSQTLRQPPRENYGHQPMRTAEFEHASQQPQWR